MNTYRVCLFGHRQLYDLRKIEQRLSLIINNMIQTKPFVEFFLGRNGEFDEFAASVIKRVQREQNEKTANLRSFCHTKYQILIIMKNIMIT